MLVYRAELLDVEFLVSGLHQASPRRGGRAECEHDAADQAVVNSSILDPGSLRWREQAPVEGRDRKSSGIAAGVDHARDGLHGPPRTTTVPPGNESRHNRADRVMVAVKRVPDGHQSPRLGKEEEQNPVDDGQACFEQLRRAKVAEVGRAERSEQ